MDRSWLLLTKMAPPPARPDCVKRERLFERLDTGIANRLLLVCTPAGFGKTTLLSSWYADHADHPANAREPILAWLSLEPADNDPARFWVYVLHALQKAHEHIPDHPLLALEVPPLASTETFLTALLNAFSVPRWSPAPLVPGGTVLLLDDYHVMTNQEIHTSVAFLLEHLPPGFHLVIASRTSPPFPLTKLRADGSVAELGAEDLRFSASEIACFLQKSALPFSFTMDQIARLEKQTSGWIMPLHLAALAWRGDQDAEAFLASLRGDHHAIVEYLVAEVFEQQSADVQRFLLATSLLAQCTASLCDAMLHQTKSQLLLEQLEREHLFLVPLDETHRWYRYHALFGGFLQDRLRQTFPDEIAMWHSQAADWYLQQKADADVVEQALPHLLAVQDWARAAHLLEVTSQQMLWHSGEAITLLHWLREFPDEAVGQRPRLALASAWALTFTGQLDAAETMLQHVERFLNMGNRQATDPNEEMLSRQLSGEVLAIRARIATFHDVNCARILSEQALEHLPHDADGLKADLLLNLGYAHMHTYDFVAAGRVFGDARSIGRRSGNVRAVMLASRYLASSYRTRGLLNDATTVSRQALRWATEGLHKPPLAAGSIYISNAFLLYERNEVDAALEQAQQGLALGRRSGEIKTLFPGYLALAQIHQGMGDLARAWQALENAEGLADLHLVSWTEEEIAAARVRLHLAQGEIGLAVRVLSRDGWQIESQQTLKGSVCPPGIQLAWARVLLAQHRSGEAAALLQRLLDGFGSERPQVSTLPLVVVHVLALAASGALEQALSLLAESWPSASAQGYIRTFVDEGAPMAALLRQVMRSSEAPGVEHVLAAFSPALLEEAQPHGVDLQPETVLSPREVEVMRLMASGLSNQQIADALVVALSTVRSHTKHIYRKLGVQGRVRAIARGRALHLL